MKLSTPIVSTKSKCVICGKPLNGTSTKNCGSKDCLSEISKLRYKEKRDFKLLNRPCPCCNKIIPNKVDNYCSDVCVTDDEGMNKSEEEFIRKHKYDIVALFKSGLQLPEPMKKITEIEERLTKKYKRKHPYSLPRCVLLQELGFEDDVKAMSSDLYFSHMLTGTSYRETAFDLSRYRKLFDYGIFLGLIE